MITNKNVFVASSCVFFKILLISFAVNGIRSSTPIEQAKLATTNKPATRPHDKGSSELPELSSQESSSISLNSETTETTSMEYVDVETTKQEISTTTTTPKVCIVMGKQYQIGDHLPHDTGNCVECICGPEAQINCSPYQCAPLDEDIVDYRPPGPRQPIPDVF